MLAYLGFKYFLVHNVDLKAWCEKWGVDVFETDCYVCGKNMIVDTPFAGKNRIGLVAELCECGDEHPPFCYVDTNFDEVNLNSLRWW